MVKRGAWTIFVFTAGWLTYAFSVMAFQTSSLGTLHVRTVPTVNESRVVIASSRYAFYVEGMARDTPLHFIVDTGATNTSFTYEDALRMGLNLEGGKERCFQTANGHSCGIAVIIGELRVGGIVLHDVDADVHKQGKLHTNLLGMSFLRRLKYFEFDGKKQMLILAQ